LRRIGILRRIGVFLETPVYFLATRGRVASDVDAFRARFPILQEKIYLNSCSQGALSRDIEKAIGEWLQSWHCKGSPWDVWVDQYEIARRQFASFINARPEEVAVVPSASAGVNSLASALSYKERRKVVLGEFEFPTMGHVWLSQRARGADVTFAEASGDRIRPEAYDALVDRNTLIVPLTHICFRNGFRSPVADIVRIAHDRGALVLLDDYQDCGTRPIDVKAMNVDAYVSGTLKYLLGPPGVAFLYVRENLADSLVPTVTGWFGQRNPFAFDVKLLDPAPGTRRFEAGTPPIPSIYGAMAGVKLLQDLGLANIAAEVRCLTQALIQGVTELGIRIKTPVDSVGPLVVLQAPEADNLVRIFDENGVVCSSRHDGLRLSFHAYNTLDEVKTVLRLIAHHLELFAISPAPTGAAT
jgi:selenocysteine lyase/cysteine desulfurase